MQVYDLSDPSRNPCSSVTSVYPASSPLDRLPTQRHARAISTGPKAIAYMPATERPRRRDRDHRREKLLKGPKDPHRANLMYPVVGDSISQRRPERTRLTANGWTCPSTQKNGAQGKHDFLARRRRNHRQRMSPPSSCCECSTSQTESRILRLQRGRCRNGGASCSAAAALARIIK